MRGLPWNFSSATSIVPSGKSLMYFGLFLATGVFFIFIAFTIFLPVMVLKPQKFAICFTIGCAFIVGSLFALKGPQSQLQHMFSKEVLSLYFFRKLLYSLFFSRNRISCHFHFCILSSTFLEVFQPSQSHFPFCRDFLSH